VNIINLSVVFGIRIFLRSLGGCLYEDPNLNVLVNAAERADVEVLDLRLPASEGPAFCWNPAEGWPRISDKDIKATGAFIRHDVFGGMRDPRPAVSTRALGWYQTIWGWLLSEPHIRMFNREMSPAASNKPASLVAARRAGLPIPSTLITNQAEMLREERFQSMVAKPVLGGDYCYPLGRH
jgi:hypothetical protein